MLKGIQWINAASTSLYGATGIFCGLIWGKILNRNFIEKRNHTNHPVISRPISTCFFFQHISHISVQFFVLFVPDIFVHVCAQVNPHNDSYVCFCFFSFSFFPSLFTVLARYHPHSCSSYPFCAVFCETVLVIWMATAWPNLFFHGISQAKYTGRIFQHHKMKFIFKKQNIFNSVTRYGISPINK